MFKEKKFATDEYFSWKKHGYQQNKLDFRNEFIE